MKNAKYVLYFVLLYLFSRAQILDGIRAFDVGIFLGLVYAGENLMIIAPLYILANFLANPTLNSLLLSVSAAALTAGMYLISKKFNKRVNIIEINIIALLSRLPVLFLSISNIDYLTDNLIALAVSQVFSYFAIICLYAIIKRGIRNRMTQDEKIAASVLIAILFTALYGINIYGFTPYYIVTAFVITLLAYNLGAHTVIIAVLAGIGAAFLNTDIVLAAGIPIICVVSLMFRKLNIVFVALAYLVCDIGVGLFFNGYVEYGYLHVIAVVIGLVAVCLLPKSIHSRLRCELLNIKKGLAARAVVNMSRYELSTEIASLGKAFYDIGHSLKQELIEDQDEQIVSIIKQELTRQVCDGCERKKICYSEYSGDIAELFKGIIKGSLERGKAALIDIPPLLSSMCRKVSVICEKTTVLVRCYQEKTAARKNIDKTKTLLAEQTEGVALLMNNLSRKTNRSITVDESQEERIIEELAYRNVVCSEVLISNNGERAITLVVRQCDRDKTTIDKVLRLRTGNNWIRSDIKYEYNMMTAITYFPAPEYDLLTGECMATKGGSILSGDTRSIIGIGKDKAMIALCDGMGSGEAAEKSSSVTIAMIENLYQAGFESNTVLSLVNNLLSSSRDENFSALDLAVVDKNSGLTDFIKLGAVNSYIRCEDGIEVVEGGSLPLGIIENIKPVIARRRLNTKELCLIVSDGVQDTIGSEHVERVLQENSALNPQLVCNEIVKACIKRGIKDDITAIAMRLYKAV